MGSAVLRTMEMLELYTGAAGQSEEGKEEEINRIEKEKVSLGFRLNVSAACLADHVRRLSDSHRLKD